ncbi:epoxide hydrolase [Podospora conica]|nr:epoxide hydrolase [Schizothecium conicum]
MADPINATTGAGDEEVKAYKIHIPTKHLELTRRKLELTRLPHETPSPSSPSGWWEPKPQIESLIDFWLEKYSWRDQESILNTSAPQFRTSLPLPSLPAGGHLRLHFLHIRSPTPSAPPLLLLPPFPLTAHALTHLIAPLTGSFHLVIPTLPSLGFSDPLPPGTANPIQTSAALLNSLMLRLSYPRYLASTTSPAATAPAHIDARLIRALVSSHATSCVAAHLIAPTLRPPALRAAPLAWVRWRVARLLGGGLGYSAADVARTPSKAVDTEAAGGWPRLAEPNGLSYALCDSPVGMLVYVVRALGTGLAPERVVTMAKLAWLPGPEHLLRFWAGCERAEEGPPAGKRRGRVGVTVFGGGGGPAAWAGVEFDVVSVRSVEGGSTGEGKGVLVFEKPEVICEGVKELAKAVLARDPRAFEATGVVHPLEGVVVDKAGEAAPGQGRAAAAPTPAPAPPKGNGGRAAVLPTLGMSPIQEKEEAKFKEDKGKGVEKGDGEGGMVLTPPPQIPVRDPLVDGESPDTLVEGSKTPPLDKAVA